jgi:glutathione S-transferase
MLHDKGDAWLYGNSEVRPLEAYFDKDFGPHSRRVAYWHTMNDPRLSLKGIFRMNVGKVYQVLSYVFFPIVRFLMLKGLNINKPAYERSLEKVAQVMSKVNELLKDGRRTLCNTSKPSAADITFAALAYPIACPPQFANVSYTLNKHHLTDEFYAYVERMRATPAGQFALRMYQEHRGVQLIQIGGSNEQKSSAN